MSRFWSFLTAAVCWTWIAFAFTPTWGYEVNTHAAVTRMALERSENFKAFLRDLDFADVEYSDRFQKEALRRFSKKKLNLSARNANTVALSGAVLEDAGTRFTAHFYDPIADAGLSFVNSTSYEWGNDTGNDFSWPNALDYFIEGLMEEEPNVRRARQESLYRSIGQVSHLLEDAGQPSHTRDDSHSCAPAAPDGCSELEQFGFKNINQQQIDSEVRLSLLGGQIPLPTYRDFFDDVAFFSNQRFFSDDTIFRNYPNPSSADVVRRTDVVNTMMIDFLVWDLTAGGGLPLADPLTGDGMRLATAGILTSRIRPGTSHSLDSIDKVVIRDNAQQLMRHLVPRVAGFIDYFFRGRLLLTLDGSALVVENISDPGRVAGTGGTDFSQGEMRIYYETIDETVLELPFSANGNGISVSQLNTGAQLTLSDDIIAEIEPLRDLSLPDSERINEESRLVVTYRGDIGSAESVAGAQLLLPNNISLLISIDRSGSISTAELAQAQQAALDLVGLLENAAVPNPDPNVPTNTNRIAVHSFSTTAVSNLSFSQNFGAARSTISGLSPGGLTALFDAIVLGGNDAVQEKLGAGMANRVFLLLFTDGAENNSNASQAAAVAAIERLAHPEIEEVFLVFVGGAAGSGTLSTIAIQAGRRPASNIANFSDLRAEFQNIFTSMMTP